MEKEISHIHIMHDKGLDVRSVLEVAAEAIVNGQVECEGMEIRDGKAFMLKDMGKYEVLIEEVIPGRPPLREDLRGRSAVGMYVRRKESVT